MWDSVVGRHETIKNRTRGDFFTIYSNPNLKRHLFQVTHLNPTIEPRQSNKAMNFLCAPSLMTNGILNP